jgi:hypothetical protein
VDPEARAVVQELRALRVGYGVQEPNLPPRIGTLLRAICGVAADDSAPVLREKVVARLTGLIDELPEGVRPLMRAAFALDGDGNTRYEQRIARVADATGYSERTMKRRIDQLFDMLAGLTLTNAPERERAPSSAAAWHTSALKVALMLDLPVVEVLEQRTIVSHRPDLAEIRHSITLTPPRDCADPQPSQGVEVDLFRGGVLGSLEWLSSNRLGIRIELPRPLAAGERHEFWYRLRLDREFAPHYVCTPASSCDRFELTVRFGPGRTPSQIWLLDGEFPLELTDARKPRAPLAADRGNEVSATFADLEPNLSYGIGWHFAG